MEPMPVDEQRKNAVLPLTEQTWPEDTIPVVSVFSWVYNHAAFIRESIDSILVQQTDFPVEIIIHDDASTDGTAEIIAEYAQRYPRLFRNVMHSKNQYSQGNCLLKPLISVPKGKYIALTHGDDFWAHPLKLMRQKELLDKNSNLVLCGHRFRLASESSSDVGCVSDPQPTEGTLEDLLLKNYIHTATAMFRNGILRHEDLSDPPYAGDWFIWIQLLKHGKAGFINELMSGYRIHQGGVCSGMPLRKRLKSVTASVERLHRDFERRYVATKRQSLALYRLHLSAECQISKVSGFLWSVWMLSSAVMICPSFTLKQPMTSEAIKRLKAQLSTAFTLRLGFLQQQLRCAASKCLRKLTGRCSG